MSVVIETTVGDVTVDLFMEERPRACLNFLKLCKIKYYNYNLFHTISRGFIAQTGDPTGSRTGGESIYGIVSGSDKRYFASEKEPRIKHTKMGLISFVGDEESMIGSQFFFTLGEDLTYLDPKHCVFGEVVEGFDILEMINETICDTDDRPYQDVRITHTVILDDPYPDPKRINVPSRSPSPTPERLQGGRIAPDEEIDEMQGKSVVEVVEMQAEREAKARATILEMVGDIPDAEMAPPENVLFVCKLNPITTDDDLEIIFNRFGKIKSCEVIRDKKTGDSLQYAFIEFEDQKSCEDAYFKMDNILIDDRRIHVDFSQSVSKIRWHGKGRGVTYINSNKTDTFSIDDSKKNINLKGSRDRDTIKNYRETSKNDHNNGKNRSKFDYKSQGNRSDYRQKDSYKYKQPSRDEHRRSRSDSQNRSNSRSNANSDKRSSRDYYHDRKEREKHDSRLQGSRNDKYSSDKYKHYKKNTYESRYDDIRGSKFTQNNSSRAKTYDRKDRRRHSDSMDDEKSELKMKQSSAKQSNSRGEESKSKPKKYVENTTEDEYDQKSKSKGKKKSRKDDTDTTESETDKKRKRKRKQEVSDSESEVEYKKRKEKSSSHKKIEAKYKGDNKKSKKVETSSSSDSSDSTDSSDSEVDKVSKKKTKLKSRKDSSSDSDNYKKRKSKKR